MKARKTQIKASYVVAGITIALGLLLGAAGYCWWLWTLAERFQ